jgi:hypothetical protein
MQPQGMAIMTPSSTDVDVDVEQQLPPSQQDFLATVVVEEQQESPLQQLLLAVSVLDSQQQPPAQQEPSPSTVAVEVGERSLHVSQSGVVCW